MSDGLNKVILLGNLGADPELRYSPKGTACLNMRVATNESWIDKDTKETKERTEWHTVVVFGTRAEALSRILTKGACILVEGYLQTTSWEKDDVKRYKTEVIARDVCLTSRRPRPLEPTEELVARALGGANSGRKNNGAPASGRELVGGEELPF